MTTDAQEPGPGWNCRHNEYACADKVQITCKRNLIKPPETKKPKRRRSGKKRFSLNIPKNGIFTRRTRAPVVVVSEMIASRSMTDIISGAGRVCSLPLTARVIVSCAFRCAQTLRSVKFNEGLESLGSSCLNGTGIRKLVLPASTSSIE